MTFDEAITLNRADRRRLKKLTKLDFNIPSIKNLPKQHIPDTQEIQSLL